VKGLANDAVLAERLFDEIDPSAVAFHISPEELKGLKAVAAGKIKQVPLSSYEMVYAKKLSVFGEVQVPSPSLVSVLKKAQKSGKTIIALDMDDESYSDQYTKDISGLSMVRTSLRLKTINRKKFTSTTPEEFSVEWDRAVNTKSYMKLERARERFMARGIRNALKKHKPLLCIVELERMIGLLGFIEGSEPDM
jgi:hypothetical protein